jgi:capsular polysaccharide biosynthesis protein
MTSSSTMRTLLVRWYIMVPGLLVSLVAAAVIFSLLPPRYTSGGTAVLVQPSRIGAASGANPLLTFDPSLNTTAMIVVQALNAPQAAADLGLDPSTGTFTVKNAGSVAVTDGVAQPFISVTAQSAEPERSQLIVEQVMARVGQELNDRQSALRVAKRNAITVQSVVDATPPKPVLATPLAASGAALLLGMLVTVAAAILWNGHLARRVRRRDTRDYRIGKTVDQEIISWSPFVSVAAATPIKTRTGANGRPLR